ncbi:MAG: cation:proton antiporter [Nocardiopsaceae bacterium]|nr:cation:proton antiporter [Nocardiopsaceae bacterium]
MNDAFRSGGIGRSVRRLAYVIALALAGLLVSRVMEGAAGVGAVQVENSALYGKGVAALLAIGLFASVYGISLRELRANARVVLVAVTVGVTAKAFFSGVVMMLAYGGTGYLLLGVAVAQIDPLSVAASLGDRRMSARAKSVLSAWASFDDPVTVLLVAYLAAVALPAAARHGGGVLAGADGYLWQLALNGVLVAAAGVAWRLLGPLLNPPRARRVTDARRAIRVSGRAHVAACLVLAGLIGAAVTWGLFLGIAICGLFFRPRLGQFSDKVVNAAFYVATFLLGMLLVTGVSLVAGVLLGVSVVVAQILAGVLISRGMPRDDRARLALGQQNGITAIVLALALQPYFPVAVGVVAIAIGVVNVLHILGNGAWDLLGISHSGRKPDRVNKKTGHVKKPVPVHSGNMPGLARSGKKRHPEIAPGPAGPFWVATQKDS